MLHDKRYYIFLDFPKCDLLRETGIPLHKDKNGVLDFDEDEIIVIMKREFEKEKLLFFFGQPEKLSLGKKFWA
jgi:hypothetical protein